MDFLNSYEDARYAEAYAKLEFPGTYYLAYRDLPDILSGHVKGKKAVDFGCGAGRSTRFLQKFGFDVIGVDSSEEMIKIARQRDPHGTYSLIKEGDLSQFVQHSYDLVLSAFTFDNIPTLRKKVKIFRELGLLLKREGRIINLVSTPDIYTHEWASFSTKDFPENKQAESGDRVKIIGTELDDKRPVEDIIWTDQDYQETYRRAGLEVVTRHKPLAEDSEPYEWVNETKIAPWCIYILKNAE